MDLDIDTLKKNINNTININDIIQLKNQINMSIISYYNKIEDYTYNGEHSQFICDLCKLCK